MIPFLLFGQELATALVYGADPSLAALPDEDPGQTPRQALESILLDALLHPPCVIGFSGGRDSAALLCLAVDLARRSGLDLPIAATNVFDGDAQASESSWQELVIARCGLPDWQRLSFDDELDVLGPVATPLLRQFGPSFPFNAHFGMPSFALAAGGTYVTGIGGDEVFEPNELTALALLLTRRLPLRRRYLRSAVFRLGPAHLRTRRYRALVPSEPWLRPEVDADLSTGIARTMAAQHVWFGQQVRSDIWRERSRGALERSVATFAALAGATVVHPFADERFLRAVAWAHPRAAWRSRAEAMQEIFGDVLADEISARRTKAGFDGIFFSSHSRSFVKQWDGSGVDTDLVDSDALRSAWMAPAVDPRSLSLLQSAWLAQDRSSCFSPHCEKDHTSSAKPAVDSDQSARSVAQ